jgi:hypothetical protein
VDAFTAEGCPPHQMTMHVYGVKGGGWPKACQHQQQHMWLQVHMTRPKSDLPLMYCPSSKQTPQFTRAKACTRCRGFTQEVHQTSQPNFSSPPLFPPFLCQLQCPPLSAACACQPPPPPTTHTHTHSVSAVYACPPPPP